MPFNSCCYNLKHLFAAFSKVASGRKSNKYFIIPFSLHGWAFNSCCRSHLVCIYQMKSLYPLAQKAEACKLQTSAKHHLDILKDRHIKLKHTRWTQSCEFLLASRNNQSAVFNRIVINNRAIILCRLPFGCFFKQLRKLYTQSQGPCFQPGIVCLLYTSPSPRDRG